MEEHKEALSALMDGELPPARASRSIDVLARDPELRRHWARYHLVRDALRNNLPEPGVGKLCERVRTAVASEPIPISRGRRWQPLQPRRLALTAALGLAVFGIFGGIMWGIGEFGSQPAPSTEMAKAPSTPHPPSIAAAGAKTQNVVSASASEKQFRWHELAPVVERRLNGYLVNHTEHARGGMGGMLPYARIVAYEQSAQ